MPKKRISLCPPTVIASLCFQALTHAAASNAVLNVDGAIIRGSTSEKRIGLVFTGHEFAEGGDVILSELKRHHAKASFFLTGQFLDNTNFASPIRRIVNEGHYLGPHSDRHLLYCSWESPKRTLISRDDFGRDLENNLKKIEWFGIGRNSIRYFLPPFEHYNQDIATWTKELGLTLVNYTPGTRSNADYTAERENNFVSSETILKSIFDCERTDRHGLNGFILLLHIGSGPSRADKFHGRFGEMLDRLSEDGYRFVRVDEMLRGSTEVK